MVKAPNSISDQTYSKAAKNDHAQWTLEESQRSITQNWQPPGFGSGPVDVQQQEGQTDAEERYSHQDHQQPSFDSDTGNHPSQNTGYFLPDTIKPGLLGFHRKQYSSLGRNSQRKVVLNPYGI